MKNLPIGISDFKKLIDNDYYYIDKTHFIQEIIEASGEVILISRPRRFGKTLNLSMLKYFFEKNNGDTNYLFQNTKIKKYERIKEYQNQYPVIFLTFKDIKADNWQDAYQQFVSVISQEFARHSAIINQGIGGYQFTGFMEIVEKRGSKASYENSLLLLTEILSYSYKKNVIVLIDEYDSPIHNAYGLGYYKQMINFVGSLLSAVLKDNPYLQKGVLTGILRIAKESIFSDLNNLAVYTILDIKFQDKFGFTQDEVNVVLNDYKLYDKSSEIQQWYNGYKFGETTIYNPWSLISCIENYGIIRPYWVNTSSNLLVRQLLLKADRSVKSKLELLLSDQSIRERVDDAVVFQDIERQEAALWALLIFTGYLTYSKKELIEGIIYCDLVIPNKEVTIVYNDVIASIFQSTLPSDKIKRLVESLTTGNIQSFAELLQDFIMSSISVFDLPSNEPEKSYHLFILGLLSILQGKYQVKSNRESGYGRYDIMLIPSNLNDLGIVMEFKKTLLEDNSDLELAAKRALEQIKHKYYVQELRSLGIKKVKGIGIAFLGKKLLVKSEDL